MFATASPSLFWGACPHARAVGGLRSGASASCDCVARTQGGISLRQATAAGDDAPGKETLLGRLDALLPRETVKECLTGSSSGLAFAPDSAALASDGAVSLVIMGDVNLMEEEAADGLTDRERVAWQLLDAYTSCADASFESLQATLTAGLAALSGGFAFVLHDRTRHRVVAARDRAGAQTLLWGMTADASLVFSSTSESAIDQAVNPQAFPPGCLFISDVETRAFAVFVRGATPGALTSFARAPGKGPIPRASSSSNGLCRIASGTDLTLITSMLRSPSFNDLAPAGMRGAAR